VTGSNLFTLQVILTTVGVAIGIPLAVAASGLVASLLFGVRRSDPMTLIACAVFFILLGVAACLQPARRALSVQPMDALRSEQDERGRLLVESVRVMSHT